MMKRLLESTVERLVEEKIAQLLIDTETAHKRLNMVNERLANIEHYLGLRRHDHTKIDLRWRFMQAQADLKNEDRPKELFFKHRPMRQAA